MPPIASTTADDDALEGIGEDAVELAAMGAKADGEQGWMGVRGGLLGSDRGHLSFEARIEVGGDRCVGNRIEAADAEGSGLGLRLQQVFDNLFRAGHIGRSFRNREADDHRHVKAAFGTGGRREGHIIIGVLAERVLQASDMVPGDEHVPREQRLLHEVIIRRVRADVLQRNLKSAHIFSAGGEAKVVTTPPVWEG
jgi:hypothetical protein